MDSTDSLEILNICHDLIETLNAGIKIFSSLESRLDDISKQPFYFRDLSSVLYLIINELGKYWDDKFTFVYLWLDKHIFVAFDKL